MTGSAQCSHLAKIQLDARNATGHWSGNHLDKSKTMTTCFSQLTVPKDEKQHGLFQERVSVTPESRVLAKILEKVW